MNAKISFLYRANKILLTSSLILTMTCACSDSAAVNTSAPKHEAQAITSTKLTNNTPQKKKKVTLKNGQVVTGYQVVFDFTGHVREREIALQYFLGVWGMDWKFELKDVGVDLYDLDGDGKQEIIAYLDPGNCPRAGCPIVFLRTSDSTYQDLSDNKTNWMTDEPPMILDSATLGYHDILLGVRERLPISIIKWDGTMYER